MHVRNYRAGDFENVVEIWNTVFPNLTGHNEPRNTIERKLMLADDLFFVAVDGDAVIGSVLAGYDGHRGWLYCLAVAPSHQRKGIGTQLVRHAEVALASLGCPKLNLQVRVDNEDVVSFYESLGFVAEERISMGKRIVD